MRIVSKFAGKNSEFRGWLAARLYPNVVSLAEYRSKRKYRSKRAARRNSTKPIIA